MTRIRARSLALAGLAVLAGLLALSLSSCGRKPAEPAAPPEFPFPSASLTHFVLGPAGLSLMPPGTELGPGASLQAPFAPRTAALAVNPARPGLIMAALNRYGLGLIELKADLSAFKVTNRPLAETASQSVAALWPRRASQGAASDDGFLLELYRDPFVIGALPRSDTAPELLSLAPDGSAKVLDRLGKPDEELFSLFPGPKGLWYAELRSEKELGARIRYVSLASPEGGEAAGQAAKELKRGLFEASLAPRPLSLAPSVLRRSAEAFGSAVLVHARGADGSDAFWLSGGKPEEAREAFAWISEDEESAVVLDRSGHGAFVARSSGLVALFSLAPPLPDAVFTSVAAVFSPPAAGEGGDAKGLPQPAGVLAAAWEKGVFPCVSASGLSVAALTLGR